MSRYIIFADRLYTLRALKSLHKSSGIAAIVHSYSSPALTFAKYNKIPAVSTQKLLADEAIQNHLFKNNARRRVVDFGLQLPMPQDQKSDHWRDIEKSCLQDRYKLALNNFGGDLAYEHAIVNTVNYNSRRKINMYMYQVTDVNQRYSRETIHAQIYTNLTVKELTADALTCSTCIQKLARSLESLSLGVLEGELAVTGNKLTHLNEESKNYESRLTIPVDVPSDYLKYRPDIDTADKLFNKNLAFYRFTHINASRMHVTTEDAALGHQGVTKDLFLVSLNQLTTAQCQYVTQCFRKTRDNAAKREKLNHSDVSCGLTGNKLSAEGIPAGTIYFLDAYRTWKDMSDLFSRPEATKRTSKSLAFIHTVDGKWVEIMAFSNNGVKVMEPGKLELALRSQQVLPESSICVNTQFQDSYEANLATLLTTFGMRRNRSSRATWYAIEARIHNHLQNQLANENLRKQGSSSSPKYDLKLQLSPNV